MPLYDSLGESSVEYIIGHSEASIVFTSTQKFPLLEKTLHKTKEYIKTIVYFGDVTEDSKRTSQAAEQEVRLLILLARLGMHTCLHNCHSCCVLTLLAFIAWHHITHKAQSVVGAAYACVVKFCAPGQRYNAKDKLTPVIW